MSQIRQDPFGNSIFRDGRSTDIFNTATVR